MNLELILSVFWQDSLNIVWLGCALFIANALEVFLWKTKLFDFSDRPIHLQLFGANKKWRALITLPLTHLVIVYLLQNIEKHFSIFPENIISFSSLNCLSYGLLVGFIFNLSELPNSFLKRRLSIAPGEESNALFYFIDHMDSTYGTLLLMYLYFHFPLHLILTGLVTSPFVFIAATRLRKKLGLKS